MGDPRPLQGYLGKGTHPRSPLLSWLGFERRKQIYAAPPAYEKDLELT